MNSNMITLMTTFKKETESSPSESTNKEAEVTKVIMLTKPAKDPTWTKDMSLETYNKKLASWAEMNEDVPDYGKYHDLIEELKKNKEIKGLQRYIADHILTVLEKRTDQTLDRVASLLDIRYGRSRTEKVEEAIVDLFKFREDDYE